MKRLKSTVTIIAFSFLLTHFGHAEENAWHSQHVTVETTEFTGKISWVRQNTSGDAKATLIAIHGTPGSWTAWKPLMENQEINQHFDVIAYDRPGWGDSQGEEEAVYPALAIQADILASAILKLDIQGPVIFIAHSWGGPVILSLASRYPEIADGLVLIASPADPRISEPRWYHHLAKTQPIKFLIGKSMRRSNIEMLSLDDELKLLANELDRIELPVAIIQGKKDWLVKPQNAFYLQRELTNADVFLDYDLETNHFIPFNDTPRVVDALNWTLESIDQTFMLCETERFC